MTSTKLQLSDVLTDKKNHISSYTKKSFDIEHQNYTFAFSFDRG